MIQCKVCKARGQKRCSCKWVLNWERLDEILAITRNGRREAPHEKKENICNSHNPRRIDKCMTPYLEYVKRQGHNPVACCCGHGRYEPTIVCKNQQGLVYEVLDKRLPVLPRKRRFYRKDKQGYYYIPEVKNAL
jgi:hypothetical protein